ncbi:hypothetical protein B0T25DRAFT_574367 [Lasiosphaeria hispida]|uniref:Protein kinase domain-containing protein n=1 Tax=Lasiosphaeria hispida TaxID=260671 RepID=A0AAJ0M8U9_9PEZI|nr:hypothetical protein B0T25DRAFT_574367 [Lasiosphaeria hispida]
MLRIGRATSTWTPHPTWTTWLIGLRTRLSNWSDLRALRILRYHGCRVRNDRVTGVLLAHVPGHDLSSHLQNGGTVDKELFLATLASAVDYLHNVVGLVHNNIHPGNIMVRPDGTPILIDLGLAYPVGEEMLTNVPFECWGEDPLDMEPETHFVGPLAAGPTSRKSRDIASLNYLRTWIDNPDIETASRRRRNKASRTKAAEGNETAA